MMGLESHVLPSVATGVYILALARVWIVRNAMMVTRLMEMGAVPYARLKPALTALAETPGIKATIVLVSNGTWIKMV